MIGIRADGNEYIGTGHLSRCLAIGEELREGGREVVFLLADQGMRYLTDRHGFQSVCLEGKWNDLEAELDFMKDLIRREKIELLIVDSYFVTPKYMAELEQYTRVAYIDDLHREIWDCSVLINYAIYHDLYNYGEEYKKTRLILGCRYVPLRREFAGIGEKNIRLQIKKILILTGGTDPYSFGLRFLHCAIQNQLNEERELCLICGNYNKDKEKLVKLSEENKNIKVMAAVSDLKSLMQEADLAISAGGVTLYELCACGTPAICYSFADNQLENVKAFDRKGLMRYVGDLRWDEVYDKITTQILLLEEDWSARKECSDRMRNLIDGKGAKRIAGELGMPINEEKERRDV